MNTYFADILSRRLSRRSVIRAGGMAVAASGLAGCVPPAAKRAQVIAGEMPKGEPFALNFSSVAKGYTPNLALARGYQAQVLMRWGDAVLPKAPVFNPVQLTAEDQAHAFGYNNDFTAYLPLKGSSRHGLLHVNHEYTNAHLMFPNTRMKSAKDTLTAQQLRIEMAAQGGSTLEVLRDAVTDQWSVLSGSRYNRRITATTPMRLSGPAAWNARMRTAQDPQGATVKGTFANCAGGVTPWGTVLMSEENFDGYFHGKTRGKEAENHARYTVAKRPYYGWHRIDDRFDVAKTPNEPNRFGWVVEYNPYDPTSMPLKRTALGRFKHESATVTVAPSGQIVVYSGDDDYFEYIYRYVSKARYNAQNPAANRRLLDDGTLSAARFDAEGGLQWMPLIYGENGLDESNGFTSQADVLIEARRAGDVLGATKMDRPEGIAIHPQSGGVFVSLTKNPKRQAVNAANPRKFNQAGHIVQMVPPGGDHTAGRFGWEMAILAGDPDLDAPNYPSRPAKSGWFGCPDNLAFHPSGSLWIATDGMPEAYGVADGLYATDIDGAPKCFLRGPKGAEITGPSFTPDGQTLFLSIQHPGEEEGSTFDTPATRWPDFEPNMPPRPSVVAVTKLG